MAVLLRIAAVLLALAAPGLCQPPPFMMPPPGGGGFPMPPGMGPERKLVKQFDANMDKTLDAAERKAAYEFLVKEREESPRPPFGRFPGGPGGRRQQMEPAQPGVKLKPADVKRYGKEALYDAAVLRTVFIEFEDAGWEKQLEAFHNTDVEIPAVVTVDGRKYNRVGVNFRGNSSFMMVPEGRKRSLKLSFDYADEKQNLGGYRTVNLLNSHMDATFLRTVLFMDIARNYLPAPKANFMRVVINGESWGLYVNAQQFNTDFIREWYKPGKGGARWKAPGSPFSRAGLSYLGDDIEAYRKIYEIKSKDDDESWRALIGLCKTLNETPPADLKAALASRLDIDGALRYLALDNVFINNDGYWARASDYNLYLDGGGKFHIVPHDANETFHPVEQFGPPGGFRGRGGKKGGPGGPPPPGMMMPFPPPGFGPGGPDAPPQRPRSTKIDLEPTAGADDPNKALLHRLLAVPALKAKYLGYVKEIATAWLDWAKLEPAFRRYRALIEADVKADTRKLSRTEAFAEGIDGEGGGEMSLKTFVEKRRAYLLTGAASNSSAAELRQ